jgi:alpha-beta hydrolase superfamily lysophospholipase
MLTCFAYVLHPQLLSQSSADVPALQAEVTWAREAVPDTLAAHTTTTLAAAVQDTATLHVKDVEDQAALAE